MQPNIFYVVKKNLGISVSDIFYIIKMLQAKKICDKIFQEHLLIDAEVAQLVEQLIRNQQVVGSSPIFSLFFMSKMKNGKNGGV